MTPAGAQSDTFAAVLPAAAPDALVPAAQVTLVLLLALALAWFMRRGSSRTLHLLWTATFALVLALPVLGLLGPSWEIPLLPAREGESPAPAIERATSVTFDPAPGPSGLVATLEVAGMREALVQAERARLDARADAAGSAASAAIGHSVVRVAWIVWLVGCVLSLASLAFAALRLRRLVRTAPPVRDPEWVRAAATLRLRLGLRREVRLLSGEAVATPMTGGLWRPVILLPASAATWSPERRTVVLTHELIHVRRRDALRQLIRRVVLALHWFHPLAWIASRRAELASEKACDEEVLALGARPSDYARHLLFLAAGLPRGPRALALPLAHPIVHPSQLERRITSILARRRPRPSLARAALTLAVLGAAGVFVAAARPVPVGDAIQESVRCSGATDAAASMFPLGDGMLVEDWRGGERAIERFVEGMHLCMRESGEVVTSADGTTVQALGAESWLVLESRAGSVHRLVIARGSGGIEREWSVDGVRQTFDADARRWRDLMFIVLKGSEDTWQVRSEEARLRNRISDHRGHVAARRGLVEALEGQVARLTRGGTLTERQVELLRGRITQLRAEMEAYDLDGKVREVRREIETLDADARAADVESGLQDEIVELQRLIG